MTPINLKLRLGSSSLTNILSAVCFTDISWHLCDFSVPYLCCLFPYGQPMQPSVIASVKSTPVSLASLRSPLGEDLISMFQSYHVSKPSPVEPSDKSMNRLAWPKLLGTASGSSFRRLNTSNAPATSLSTFT